MGRVGSARRTGAGAGTGKSIFIFGVAAMARGAGAKLFILSRDPSNMPGVFALSADGGCMLSKRATL